MGAKQSTPSEITIYNEPQIRVNISLLAPFAEELTHRCNIDFQFSFHIIWSINYKESGWSKKLQEDNTRKTSKPSTRLDTNEPILPEELDRLVRARVEEELNRIRERDEEIQQRAKEELFERTIIEDSGANAVVTERDIQELILRVERKFENKVSPDLIEHQQAVISCYK
ncbi:4420_t:CDS:2 [Acaulospora morrowiae]|uniref:4420_t:CDS:1 n=1 Tax=Acaulospora morrowiae TaxID=94023 RepID=A0A9N8ZAP8_9GLOM|nr:4420_t:CDS:2 [Acaulospora morrowiae]